MGSERQMTRRSAVAGAAGAAALGRVGRPGRGNARESTLTPTTTPVTSITRVALWQPGSEAGLVFGTSLATWQAEDAEYLQLVNHEAAVLLTEDDLLWWRPRPTPDSELDFQYGDRFIAAAESQQQLVFGAHLVWD